MLIGVGVCLLVAAAWAAWPRQIPFEKLDAKYANRESEFVTLPSGTRAHIRNEGPKDAPVVLAVHDAAGSLHDWSPWVKAMKSEFRVISVDLPDHGLTRSAPGHAPSVATYVQFLDELIQARRLTRVNLAGHGFGGRVAWEYALAHPGKVEKLVLIGAGWPGEGTTRPLSKFAAALEQPRLPPWEDPARAWARSRLEAAYSRGWRIPEAMVDRSLDLNRAPGRTEALRRLSRIRARSKADMLALLPRLKTPIYVHHGGSDRIVPVSELDFIDVHATTLTGLEETGFGHAVHLQRPEAAAYELTDFIGGRTYRRAKAIEPRLQAAATAGCKCARVAATQDAKAKCWSDYRALTADLNARPTASACFPVSVSLDCFGGRGRDTVCVQIGFGALGNGLCTPEEVDLVEGAWSSTLRRTNDHRLAGQAAARVARTLIAGGAPPAGAPRGGGCGG